MTPPSSSIAIVTLVTSSSFFPGLHVLLHSLTKTVPSIGKAHKLMVLYTPGSLLPPNFAILSKYGCSAVLVDQIPLPMKETASTQWLDTYTKLRIFDPVVYGENVPKAALYIDADCLVQGDPLVYVRNALDDPEWNGFSAAPDVFPPDRFNAGVLIVRPDKKVFDAQMLAIETTESYDDGDTGFLNAFFSDWFSMPITSRLPFRMNAQRTLHWLTYSKRPGYWDVVANPSKFGIADDGIVILHLSSTPKPWDDTSRKGDLELIWWESFVEASLVGGGGEGVEGGEKKKAEGREVQIKYKQLRKEGMSVKDAMRLANER